VSGFTRVQLVLAWTFASLCGTTPTSFGQGEAEEDVEMRLQFVEASWFLEEVSTALLFVDSKTEPVLPDLPDTDEIRFIDSEVAPLEKDERGNFVFSLRFLPLRTGIRVFPSLTIEIDGQQVVSPSRQFLVGEPHTSEAMSFSIEAEKTRVFVGEPLRLDFVWRCDLPMNQMRELRLYPSFFNNSDVEVVIPRSDVPEEEQFGLPIGGRRAIAHRTGKEDLFPPSLGELRFSVFVRFEEPGPFEISRTRLLCSRLLVENAQSNRYAAYFNNALFEPVDRSSPHEKLHAFSEPLAIEVRALPGKDRLESFSGLFDPEAIEVRVQPTTTMVGQLMEIRIDVSSEDCSEMLQLPDISRQASLRNRFWVGQDANEIWKPDGRSFVFRARPLSVEVIAFPSLAFQVFDSDAEGYRVVQTRAIPLDISAREGKEYFPIGKIPGAQYPVVASGDGIWHNLEATIMSDALNTVVNGLADGVWAFVLLGPILFYGLSFWARERRRRAIDEAYRVRRAAYENFKTAVSEGDDDVEALRTLVAACFKRKQSALTAKDVARLLKAAESDSDLAAEIERTIGECDVDSYRPSSKGERKSTRTGKLGEQVYRLFQRGLVSIFMMVAFVSIDSSSGADWEWAESLFSEALESAEAVQDSTETERKFAEAALEFESCAENGVRAGRSWYNAGNAWFKAGEIGRAIANYRQAQTRMPFNAKLASSLEAARALRLDSVSETGSSMATPIRWQKASFSLLWLAAFGVALFWVRYRSRLWLIFSGVAFASALLQGFLITWKGVAGLDEGVLIVDEVYGRKGPGYSYLSAYTDPLHNGLELSLLERRKEWVRARMGDGSDCWLPAATVQILEK